MKTKLLRRMRKRFRFYIDESSNVGCLDLEEKRVLNHRTASKYMRLNYMESVMQRLVGIERYRGWKARHKLRASHLKEVAKFKRELEYAVGKSDFPQYGR